MLRILIAIIVFLASFVPASAAFTTQHIDYRICVADREMNPHKDRYYCTNANRRVPQSFTDFAGVARSVCVTTNADGSKRQEGYRVNHSYGPYPGGPHGVDMYDITCLQGPPAERTIDICEGDDCGHASYADDFAIACFRVPKWNDTAAWQAYADGLCAWTDPSGAIHAISATFTRDAPRSGGQCGSTHYTVHCPAGK
jgi:hypothetical protein